MRRLQIGIVLLLLVMLLPLGLLPRALAARVPDLRVGQRVGGVDLARRRVEIEGGGAVEYDRLVVTLPLPAFLQMARGGPGELAGLAAGLDWSVVACLNLGIARPGLGGGLHWIYFPDPDVPFYRVGFPTNFSRGVAPEGSSSLYVEFGLGRHEPFDAARLESAALEGLRNEGILQEGDRRLVRDWVRIDPGYVIFDRSRREVLARVTAELERLGVHLIGRYGAWGYSYMEQALLDGLECAARLRGEEP